MENSPKYGTTPPSKTTGYSVTRPHNPIHDIRLIIPALYLWGMTITVLHTGVTGLIAYNAVLIGLSILGAGITLWKTRSAQPHKLALILLPLLITSLAGSLNLGLRLPLAIQVTAGDVAEVKGKIITRPTTYPTPIRTPGENAPDTSSPPRKEKSPSLNRVNSLPDSSPEPLSQCSPKTLNLPHINFPKANGISSLCAALAKPGECGASPTPSTGGGTTP